MQVIESPITFVKFAVLFWRFVASAEHGGLGKSGSACWWLSGGAYDTAHKFPL
jgi:hypothetical protein